MTVGANAASGAGTTGAGDAVGAVSADDAVSTAARGIVLEIEVRLEVDLRQRNALPWFGSGFEWSDFIAARIRRAEGLDDGPAPERERVAPGPRIP